MIYLVLKLILNITNSDLLYFYFIYFILQLKKLKVKCLIIEN